MTNTQAAASAMDVMPPGEPLKKKSGRRALRDWFAWLITLFAYFFPLAIVLVVKLFKPDVSMVSSFFSIFSNIDIIVIFCSSAVAALIQLFNTKGTINKAIRTTLVIYASLALLFFVVGKTLMETGEIKPTSLPPAIAKINSVLFGLVLFFGSLAFFVSRERNAPWK
jgi:hypothetical protein